MLSRFAVLGFAVGALIACSTTRESISDIEIPVVCQSFINRRDVAEIAALLATRPDIRRPFWGITCDDHGHTVAQSGPHRSGDISNFVTLARKGGAWRIIKIEEGPVVVITQWQRNGPNPAMQLTASKPVVYAWSVCRRQRMLRGMHRGLAAADLVLVKPARP